MNSLSIKLAGSEYTIDALNLGQLRDLGVGVTLPDVTDPQEQVRRSFDRAVAVISGALRVKYPEMTADKLYEMPISRDEMREANDAVLRFSGLIPPATPASDAPSGEAVAGA